LEYQKPNSCENHVLVIWMYWGIPKRDLLKCRKPKSWNFEIMHAVSHNHANNINFLSGVPFLKGRNIHLQFSFQ